MPCTIHSNADALSRFLLLQLMMNFLTFILMNMMNFPPVWSNINWYGIANKCTKFSYYEGVLNYLGNSTHDPPKKIKKMEARYIKKGKHLHFVDSDIEIKLRICGREVSKVLEPILIMWELVTLKETWPLLDYARMCTDPGWLLLGLTTFCIALHAN